MKRNFYLQHSLMAMNDPRMRNLTEEEGPNPERNWNICALSAAAKKYPLPTLQKSFWNTNFSNSKRTDISPPKN